MLAQLFRALSLVSMLSPPGHSLIVCRMTAVLFASATLPGRSFSTFNTGHLLALLEQRVCQHFPGVYNLAANVCAELKIVA